MSFWEHFTEEEIQKINQFHQSLKEVDDNLFRDEAKRPTIYEIAQSTNICLKDYPKDGFVLQG